MEDSFQVIENYLMVRMPEEIDHHKSVYISKKAEDTKFMDSSGIGIIIGRYKKISYFGGKVFVINTDTRIKKSLMICGLHKIIEIME